MPKLIKDGAVASQDGWQLLTEETVSAPAELPAGKLIVPVNYWLAERGALTSRAQEIGVWLSSDQLAEMIGDLAPTLPLIALHFPTFMDGRGFSTARLLRESFAFEGELRAIGHIIRDQLFYLKRCGFNSFEFEDSVDAEAALASLNDFSNCYQAAVDQRTPLYRRRA